MLAIKRKKINEILGKVNQNSSVLSIFDDNVVDFLHDIFLSINKLKNVRDYPDLVTFGFWCRASNLRKLSSRYKNGDIAIGRGKVLHIAPSNVPMNFAYSFAFGLLSGNTNIVRLPSRNFIQVNLLCKIIAKSLKKKKFNKLSNYICFIKYDRSDEISSYLSMNADARMIWGGDETINQFKSFKTSPRCIDLTFANRYSVSIIDTNQIALLNEQNLRELIRKFYTDCYLMDQQGCSSPQAIIWRGDKNNSIIKKFWQIFSHEVVKNYEIDLSVSSKKISSIASMVLEREFIFDKNFNDFRVLRLQIEDFNRSIDDMNFHFGTFCEIKIKKLSLIKKIFTKKIQTITSYGLKERELENFILRNNINGVDRIVPIGRAHDMGPIWDGHDIIASLSRIIGN